MDGTGGGVGGVGRVRRRGGGKPLNQTFQRRSVVPL